MTDYAELVECFIERRMRQVAEYEEWLAATALASTPAEWRGTIHFVEMWSDRFEGVPRSVACSWPPGRPL